MITAIGGEAVAIGMRAICHARSFLEVRIACCLLQMCLVPIQMWGMTVRQMQI